MKINMIGSGSIGSVRMSACTLMDDHILIEVPNGIIKYLKNQEHDIMQIDTILITHFHGDHFFDLPFYLLEFYFQRKKKKIKIIGPVGLKEKVETLFEFGFPQVLQKVLSLVTIQWIELKPDDIYQDKTIKVEAKEVEHGSLKPALGYLITIGNKTLAYSGDTSLCSNVLYLVEHASLSILDMSLKRTGNGEHMGYKDICKICEDYPDKRVIVTHMRDDTILQVMAQPLRNMTLPTKYYEIEI